MKIYVVVVDAVVSQEGYDSLEKAKAFIKSRADKPQIAIIGGYNGWSYISEKHSYYIREIDIK